LGKSRVSKNPTSSVVGVRQSYVVIRMTGNFSSIHNVPEETIERMKNNMEDISNEWIIKY